MWSAKTKRKLWNVPYYSNYQGYEYMKSMPYNSYDSSSLKCGFGMSAFLFDNWKVLYRKCKTLPSSLYRICAFAFLDALFNPVASCSVLQGANFCELLKQSSLDGGLSQWETQVKRQESGGMKHRDISSLGPFPVGPLTGRSLGLLEEHRPPPTATATALSRSPFPSVQGMGMALRSAPSLLASLNPAHTFVKSLNSPKSPGAFLPQTLLILSPTSILLNFLSLLYF